MKGETFVGLRGADEGTGPVVVLVVDAEPGAELKFGDRARMTIEGATICCLPTPYIEAATAAAASVIKGKH